MPLSDLVGRVCQRLRRLFLPTCQELSQLTSQALDQELAWYHQPGRWLHLTGCRLCRRYRRQLLRLRNLLRAPRFQTGPIQNLPPGVRARLRQRLQAELNHPLANPAAEPLQRHPFPPKSDDECS